MTRLTLNQKLWSVLVFLWLGLGTLVITSAWMTRTDMLEQRESMLSQQIDTAMGVISYYQKKVADHTLSVADAKHQALENLRGLRYGTDHSGYFGIYDSALTLILMPLKPDLESKSQPGLVDSNGTHRPALTSTSVNRFWSSTMYASIQRGSVSTRRVVRRCHVSHEDVGVTYCRTVSSHRHTQSILWSSVCRR